MDRPSPSTATSRARYRCLSSTYARGRCGSSLQSGGTRIQPGHPTAVIWRSCRIVRDIGSSGSSIWKPAVSARCCNRAARGCRPGLRVCRRPYRRPLEFGETPPMKRLPLLLLGGFAIAAVAACPGKKPETTPLPQAANADSAAEAQRLEEERRAREAADAAAREAAEREARQRVADSLAALGRTTEAVKTILATLIHFDYDKAIIRGGDAAVLDQKVAILQANPGLRIRISGHCDERGSDEYNLALGNRRATAAKQYLVSHGIDSVRALLAVVQEKLAAQQAYLVQLRGDMKTDLLAMQQQVVTVQELTGQSQQRLTELRGRLEEQARQPVPVPDTSHGGNAVPVGPSGTPAGPGPDRMFDLSLQQFRRGSLGPARPGFREFVRGVATHGRAPDALFYVGETFAGESADSAAAVYQQVVKTFPNSPRAPSALYKLGLLAEQRGDKAAARTYYARVIAGYPRSDEANLARDKLQRLGR